MTATSGPRSWPVDRLRAAEAAYRRHGDRTPEAVLGHREYRRRWQAARRRGQVWPPTPAPPPVLPPLPARLAGEPAWSDAELRAAAWAYRQGSRTPDVVVRHRLYQRLTYRARRARARAALVATDRAAFLTDVAEMADAGETLPAVAMRLHRTEVAVRRRLLRCDEAGRDVLARLDANASGHGHVRQGALRRWAS